MDNDQLLRAFYNALLITVSQLQKHERNELDRAIIQMAEDVMRMWRERQQERVNA